MLHVAAVQGLASASPANLVDHQIELLRVIAESAPTAVHGWLVAALADPGLDLGALPRQGAAGEALLAQGEVPRYRGV